MSEPTIAQKGPYTLELEPGEYWFCACGKSASQPFCDGSHKDTDFGPLQFKQEQQGTVYLCGCKHSQGLPFCDGSHQKL